MNIAFQYAVKFVCGRSDAPDDVLAVARGMYYTAINVHNPSCGEVVFQVKVAAAPLQQRPGLVSAFHVARLDPDHALEIDCHNIRDYFPREQQPPGLEFFKGFVVIESCEELDVVAVYTVAPDVGGPIQTMHMERVPPRRH